MLLFEYVRPMHTAWLPCCTGGGEQAMHKYSTSQSNMSTVSSDSNSQTRDDMPHRYIPAYNREVLDYSVENAPLIAESRAVICVGPAIETAHGNVVC